MPLDPMTRMGHDLTDQLLRAVGRNNGCTAPVSFRVRAPLVVGARIGGSQLAVTNRYHSPPVESFEPYLEPRRDLGGRSVADVVELDAAALHCLDFGTVSGPRVPVERAPLSDPARESVQSRLDVAARAGVDVDAEIIAALRNDDDLAATARLVELAAGSADPGHRIATAARHLLGWDEREFPTVFAAAGTYLNAHLGILAGATVGQGGGALVVTCETGGNAGWAGWLQCPRFGCDLAGRPLSAGGEPIYADARTPAVTYVVALRDAAGQLRWGPDAPSQGLSELVGRGIERAVDEARAASAGEAIRVVVYVPDRPKTAVPVGIDDLREIAAIVADVGRSPDVAASYLFIDGCQTRGLTVRALAHPAGPIRWYDEQGVHIAGVSWSTSKGPGGMPFAAALTMRRDAFDDLLRAIETGEATVSAPDGFVARYLCRGDLPVEAHAAPLVSSRSIRDHCHHVRLTGDLPRLWRWVDAHADLGAVRAVRARLAAELRAVDDLLRPVEAPSDPTVLNYRLTRAAAGSVDPETMTLSLRWGFDITTIPSLASGSTYERAAGLLPTPVGMAVAEPWLSTTVRNPVFLGTHPGILRFGIPLELVELGLHDRARFEVLLPKVGRLLCTRIRLAIDGYDELAAAVHDADNAHSRAEAELLGSVEM